nr:uncharacterized protein LOC121828640 [Peromyscus maniculatus bairdii]
MTTQCVTHQLAAATSPSPQELRMEAARGAQKEQAHCRRGGGRAIREHWLRLCCLENRNQEWGSSSASKREINPKASLQNAELHPERSHMGTGNRHHAACLSPRMAPAHLNATFQVSLCLGLVRKRSYWLTCLMWPSNGTIDPERHPELRLLFSKLTSCLPQPCLPSSSDWDFSRTALMAPGCIEDLSQEVVRIKPRGLWGEPHFLRAERCSLPSPSLPHQTANQVRQHSEVGSRGSVAENIL